jgi:hypothetical protein
LSTSVEGRRPTHRRRCGLIAALMPALLGSGCASEPQPTLAPMPAADSTSAQGANRHSRQPSAPMTPTTGAPGSSVSQVPTVNTSTSAQPRFQPSPTKRPSASAIRKSFSALSARLGGSVGLAYVPLGRGGRVTSFGSLKTGVGWSTMKVPVAIASVRSANGHLSATEAQAMRRALTRSDNEAAMQLWAGLGTGPVAAAKTQRALRDGGDAETAVPATRRRAGFTPFGQSAWTLADQATFAASLPCLNGSGPVLSLMGQVIPSQRWGAGVLSQTQAFKGGWGPGTDGKYLVRQLAVVKLSDGHRIGLALASKPGNGRFARGTADLSALARWAEKNLHVDQETGC